MTPELWERLKPLFDAAVERPHGEREAFIAQACADDAEMRVELEGLVEAFEVPGSAVGNISANIQKFIRTALPAFLSNEVIFGRFRIVRRLGGGGMGDVYEAFDLELSQSIAIKRIRPEIAGIPGVLSRFKKEVQLARRLSGPNICRIHELFVMGEDGAAPATAFLTMEFLEGITLAEKLRQTGPMPWREAQVIATDICVGLSTIHDAGIIHRDLKSRNIMLADRNGSRRAVLMDFGVARELVPRNAADESGLTAPGAVLGTPDYMAPEQFEGKAVTPATDIYALGVLLYELVTGNHPFAASSALGAAVLRAKPPAPASSLQHGLPRRCDLVIRKCLEYDAALRYQSAVEVQRAIWSAAIPFNLSRIPAAATAGLIGLVLLVLTLFFVPAISDRMRGILFSSSEKHIAVLPLDVAGDAKGNQALGDGLMDSLAGRLSDLDVSNRSLWVIPASEVRKFKVNDPSSALHDLGATIVIKGSFERADHAAHLRLSLIDSKKLRQIGFVDVENQIDDLAALEDEAITRLGRLLNISIEDDRGRGGLETATPAAYEDYLEALGYLQRFDQPGNLDRAIHMLQNVVLTDNDFALAFARLGRAYILKFRLDRNPEWLQQAQLYCDRAAKLQNNDPSIYIALADIQELTGQHELAISEFEKAIALDPRNPDAYSGIANSYQSDGKAADLAKAEAYYRKAEALRPEDWNGYNNLGNFYDETGRTRDAIDQYNQALRLTPDNSAVLVDLGIAYLDSGDPKLLTLAEHALEKSADINPTYQAYANLANLYGIQRRFADSVAASQKALALDDQDYAVWTNLTDAYEGLGDHERASASRKRAIALAERAVQLNSSDADARATLAALLAAAGQRDKAEVNLRASLLLSPESPSVLAEAADAYESLGDRRQAIACLERAMKNGLAPVQLNGDPLLYGIAADPNFYRSPSVQASRP